MWKCWAASVACCCVSPLLPLHTLFAFVLQSHSHMGLIPTFPPHRPAKPGCQPSPTPRLAASRLQLESLKGLGHVSGHARRRPGFQWQEGLRWEGCSGEMRFLLSLRRGIEVEQAKSGRGQSSARKLRGDGNGVIWGSSPASFFHSQPRSC